MNNKLQSLLEQLTPAERNGAVLSVDAPIPRTTRLPRAMRDEVRLSIVKAADKSDCTDTQTLSSEK